MSVLPLRVRLVGVAMVILAFLALLPKLAPAHGHGLDVESVLLEEIGANRYRLLFTGVGDLEARGMPALPAQCEWEAVEKRPAGSPGLVFVTRGKPLTAGDVIVLPWRRSGALVTARWKHGPPARRFFMSGEQGVIIAMGQLKAGSGSSFQAAKRYALLGMEHILVGIDHLLFIAGLLLLIKGWRRLAWAVTAFTVAHSLTLGLSVLGVLRVSVLYVEALIALSIILLAVENIRAVRGQSSLTVRRPWLVSFGFGLFHGLGFASALNALGLPPQEIPVALLFFNIGVELGQLAFVAFWFSLVWAIGKFSWPQTRSAVLIPGYAIGIIATAWFIERVLVMFS